jgi:hypothetical protein
MRILMLLTGLLWPSISYCQYTNTDRVAIHSVGDYYEMENGYLGLRIPKSTLFNPAFPAYVPAPVRCVVYKDGTLSNNLPNYLASTTPAQSMTTTILTETEDECKIEVSYTFNKPELLSNAGNFLEPAGPGYYRITFRMIKGIGPRQGALPGASRQQHSEWLRHQWKPVRQRQPHRLECHGGPSI